MKELNAQLVSFEGENGAEMLISAFKRSRRISDHELTKLGFLTPRAHSAIALNLDK